MYEIWLAANILWELAMDALPWLVVLLAAWVALMVAAWRRPAGKGAGARRALGAALVVTAVAAVAFLLVLPAATRSSLSELRYWVDWANALAVAGGLGAVAGAFAWPLAMLFLPPRRAPGVVPSADVAPRPAR